MEIQIGAHEAKTKLPELLRQMQAGKLLTITKRGKPIADLVPSKSVLRKDPAAAIERFLAFKKANPVRARVDIKAMMEKGRETAVSSTLPSHRL